MYAVINQMEKSQRYAGRVISAHKTLDAAVKGDERIQRMVTKQNGANSYLPTAIVVTLARVGRGKRLETGEYRDLSDAEKKSWQIAQV